MNIEYIPNLKMTFRPKKWQNFLSENICGFILDFFTTVQKFWSFQECKFQVGSYIHDATQISFTGTFGHDTVNQRAQQYEIEILDLDEVDRSIDWANRNFSYTGFQVSIKKIRLTFSFITSVILVGQKST